MSEATPPIPAPSSSSNGDEKKKKKKKTEKTESLKDASGKSLKKLTRKQLYELHGIRDSDHKMKTALAYVTCIPSFLSKNHLFFFDARQ